MTDDTRLVTLKPANPSKTLQFTGGQYATFSFSVNGRPTPARCFSLVSAPNDPRTVQFAMRVKGAFTTKVSQLQPGTPVHIQGPFGNFTLASGSRPAVLLAGGIGITPYIGMIRDAIASDNQKPLLLLHANRSAQNMPFAAALRNFERQLPSLRVGLIAADTSGQTDPQILQGAINDNLLSQITAGNFAGKDFYICGPKGFSDSMRHLLESHGVDQSAIHSESFSQGMSVGIKHFGLAGLSYFTALTALAVLFVLIASSDITSYLHKVQKAAAVSITSTNDTTEAEKETVTEEPEPTPTPTPVTTETTTSTPTPTVTPQTPAPTTTTETVTPTQPTRTRTPPVTGVS